MVGGGRAGSVVVFCLALVNVGYPREEIVALEILTISTWLVGGGGLCLARTLSERSETSLTDIKWRRVVIIYAINVVSIFLRSRIELQGDGDFIGLKVTYRDVHIPAVKMS